MSRDIDQVFENSLAETLTETEQAFQLGFVAMTEAILIVVQSVSALVIGIILAVLCNTMAMSVRERGREYATLRALGFGPVRIAGLILGSRSPLRSWAGSWACSSAIPRRRCLRPRSGRCSRCSRCPTRPRGSPSAARGRSGAGGAARRPAGGAVPHRRRAQGNGVMAGVPYHYILRNLWVRKLTTLLTAGGMALVVFVFAAVLMLSEGLKPTLVSSFFFF